MTQINYTNIDFVVGIDFGTTFSGASYSFTREKFQKCYHITQWPKQKGYNDNQKVPTVCLFDKKQQKFTRWGRDALKYHKSNTKQQQQTDLIFVEHFNEKLRTALDSSSLDELDEDGRFYRDAAVYFLRHIVHYTRLQIDGFIANKIKSPVILYALSLPSNWSSAARNGMEKLFSEHIAETDEYFEIVDQSSSTALFAQNNQGKRATFKSGRNYLVCDLGGETSSFTVFGSVTKDDGTKALEISKTENEEKIESMIYLGSATVDKKMREYIVKLLFNNDHDAINKSAVLIGHLMDFFINSIKPIFGESVGEDVSIPLVNGGAIESSTMASLAEDDTIYSGHLNISYEAMCIHVFDPVIDEIVASIENSISTSGKTMDAILLVGGFSESFYLTAQLEERLNYNADSIVAINGGNMVTMDGAVYYGLEKVNNAINTSHNH